MAEGETPQRSIKDSFSKASGDADESFCDPCINGGKWIAVEGYCQICKEYLCENCLEVHRNQKITRSHTILDKNQMPRGQVSSASQGLCVEVCKTHHPEIVRFYCKAHDEPGCVDCMALNHSNCNRDRIQDISNGFQRTEEFKMIQQKLDKFHKELEKMKDALDDNLKDLDTTCNNIQKKISSFRKQINDYLDQIQKQVTEKAENMKKEYKTEMNKMIEKNESMKSELEDIIQKIHNDSDVNMNSLFVTTKQAKKRLVTMESEIEEMNRSQQQQQQQKYVFQSSTQIEDIISDKIPLGKLTKYSTASFRRKLNVKTREDKDCKISDCTLLGPDKMVVIDEFNNKVKLIDLSNYTIISSYRTSNVPRKLTLIDTDQIAVLTPNDKEILMLNVTSTFTEQNKIPLHHICFDIAYKDEKIAVSYIHSSCVDILNVFGGVLHTIQPTVDKNDIQLRSPYIAFGHATFTLIISNPFTHKVCVVSFEGQILHTHTHDALKVPCGMTITADGVLFVCSQGNDSIHVVSPDFKTSKIIIKNDSNVTKPESIAYCDSNNKLYISNAETGTILVYDCKV